MTYYDVLGLPPTATIDQIKKEYRRRVVLYHPDKNPDINAVEIFRSLSEAYEILSDPERKLGYDYLLNNVEVTEEPPVHRDPAYRPRATREATPTATKRPLSLRQMRAAYLPYTAKMSIACLIVAMSMVADYLLPKQYSNDRVAFIRVHSGRRYKWYEVGTDKRESFILDRSSQTRIDVNDSVVIEKTIVYGIPVAFGRNKKLVRLGSGLYGNFIFFPVLLMIISGFGVLKRNDVNWGFDFGVGSVLVLIFIVIMRMIF